MTQPIDPLAGTCHCGAVRVEIPHRPDEVTRCNCSICRRLGSVWAYYDIGTVTVHGHPERTDAYIQVDGTLRLVRCRTCGCTTHWEPLDTEQYKRLGVNVRNFDPALIAGVRIRLVDGADTWESTFVDPPLDPSRFPVNPVDSLEPAAFRVPLQIYFEAFAERDAARRHDLPVRCLTANARILGPKRVFAGHDGIAQKIVAFHANWPHGLLVLASGLNTFGHVARFANAIVDAHGAVLAHGHSMMELATDGRIARVVPFWDALPPIPSDWPRHLGVSSRHDAT